MPGITGGIPGIIGGTPVNIGGMPVGSDMRYLCGTLLFERYLNYWHTHLDNQLVACLGPEVQDALGACRLPEAEQQAAEMMKVQLHLHLRRPPHRNHPDSASSSDSLLG